MNKYVGFYGDHILYSLLLRAVDSQMYKTEKEKYMKNCLRESALLQKEREERKARLDMLLKEQRESKEMLKQARADEIKALTDLANNAELYGIEFSPRSKRRLEFLKREILLEKKAERPLQISLPKSKRAESAKGKGKGKWLDVEEEIRTESGHIITIKTRKWVPDEKKGDRSEPKQKKKKQPKVDSDDGIISISDKGYFTYKSSAMGTMEPPDPLERRIAHADNPDIWAKLRFECHTMYDHELYIKCEATAMYDINQHASPPRESLREYLESLSREPSSGEEYFPVMEKPKSPAEMLGEGEQYGTIRDGGQWSSEPPQSTSSDLVEG
ncbi:hypothetical protein PoB_001785300 [Plakobranchus ocellatus]|uniref:Uncharacterized protein n=1 Tax=Plakobranchus ocellatus TaxID=259542 RepID=A0AAV3Z9Q3_9GAST|nr:hypothetical protein PoB_001785300 [Plakobranchus ocellatus]